MLQAGAVVWRYLLSAGVQTRVLQRVDEALLGGAAGFVPFKDAGVVEHMAKHHADLLVQDVDGVIGRELIGMTGEERAGPTRRGCGRRSSPSSAAARS